MPEWTSEAKIAAAYNNAGALALVTSLTTSPVIPFQEPQTVDRNWRGVRRVGTLGHSKFGGFKRCEWLFSMLWNVQRLHLISTYESMNNGEVTIRTTFDGVSWANYNAIIQVDELGNYKHVAETQYGLAIPDFVLKFARLEAL